VPANIRRQTRIRATAENFKFIVGQVYWSLRVLELFGQDRAHLSAILHPRKS
jgi:hypothetical protein